MISLLRKWVPLMNKFWIVLSHTFLSNVKQKSFIIMTVIIALLVAVVFNLPNIISLFDKEKVKHVGVVDHSKQLFSSFDQQIRANAAGKVQLIELADEDSAKSELEEKKVVGYVVLDLLQDGSLTGSFKAMKVNNSELTSQLEQALNQVQFRLMATNLGLTEQQAAQLFKQVQLEKIPLDKNAKSEEEIVQSTVLVYILLFALYFAMIMFGNAVAMEVAKEKSSRVMEILISSVHPIAQLFGKIVGTALLGIFQFAVFIAVGYISLQFGNKTIDLGDMIVDFSDIPPSTVFYAVLFFILGYLLFSTIAAMLGSLVTRIEELQQMIMPLTLIIVAGFLISMYGLTTPDASYIVVTSFIPVFTPMIMFLRIGLSDPAVWEIVLSIGILIVTIIFTAILSAKVYRGGVLMYGKSASFKDLKKALAVHKDEK